MTFRAVGGAAFGGLGGFGPFPYYSQYPVQPYYQPSYIQPYYQLCNPMIPLAMGSSIYPSYSMPYRILGPLIESEML